MKKILLIATMLSMPAQAQTVINKPIVCGDREPFLDFVNTEKYSVLAKADMVGKSTITFWVNKSNNLLVTENYPEGVCVISGGKGLVLNDAAIKEFFSRGTH